MMTLLKSATNGWLDYTQQRENMLALLLAAILYLGVLPVEKAKQQGTVGSSRCSIYMRC